MGVFISTLVILLWGGHLYYMLLYVEPGVANPWMYVHILVQSYLFTGLFITAHDAMHGTVSTSRVVNSIYGNLASFLFAGMHYKRLRRNHGKHHKYAATVQDPDFYAGSQHFFVWWVVFMWRYVTLIQLVIMAVFFNLLILIPGVNELVALLYWALPAILGTLQLFWVGVYWPHRLPHTELMGPHKARTQRKNHFLAMISCYFFGYHREHHNNPRIPWWQLYKTKQAAPEQ
ncbi:MAG: fatty acid desaturase [Bacteroidales bacterium]|nr:fatty acid desaturase [Bacteroidales bacterium]